MTAATFRILIATFHYIYMLCHHDVHSLLCGTADWWYNILVTQDRAERRQYPSLALLSLTVC